MTTSAMLVDWVQALSSGIRHQSFSSGNVEWVEPLPPHASERDIVFEEGTVFVCESDQEIQSRSSSYARRSQKRRCPHGGAMR